MPVSSDEPSSANEPVTATPPPEATSTDNTPEDDGDQNLVSPKSPPPKPEHPSLIESALESAGSSNYI